MLRSRSMVGTRAASWLSLTLAPIFLPQALLSRAKIPRLPEAVGPRSGRVGHDRGRLRLMVLGESTAVGVGIGHLSDGIPVKVAEALSASVGARVDWRVIGRGHGMTAKKAHDALAAMETEVFDGAVVLLGVNDVFRFTGLGRWRRAVVCVVNHLRSRGCRFVVFSAVPPVGRFPALPLPLRAVLGLRAALLDAALERLSLETGLFTHCPVAFGMEAAHVASDGIHPSREGYALWAAQLASLCIRCCHPTGAWS